MRKRFQKGSLRKLNGAWVARWREDGQRKARMLGRVSSMSKGEAQTALASAVAPLNNRRSTPSEERSFAAFVDEVYFPFYKRKWKRSTAATNAERIKYHLNSEFGARALGSFSRDDLQALLDRKATKLSFSVTDHLRWDLRQIFGMAVAEGYLRKNPAAL